MSTRSRIGLEHEDGSISSIYCHFDGYPSGVGQTLIDHYADRAKVEALIALGDLSVLDNEVAPPPGVSHKFGAAAPGVTVAYGRDRGETGVEAKTSTNEDEFYKIAAEGWEEYAYLYRQGVWFVTEVGGGAGPFLVKASDPDGTGPSRFRRLEAVLAEEKAEAEAE